MTIDRQFTFVAFDAAKNDEVFRATFAATGPKSARHTFNRLLHIMGTDETRVRVVARERSAVEDLD